MKKGIAFLIVAVLVALVFNSIPIASGDNNSCAPPFLSPGGDHPDETFTYDSGNPLRESYFVSDPHALVLLNGYYNEFNSLLSN
jgi:hypothetical protein